ncbi:MAG: 50S ribosomal protein L29 [Planctomycetota bacterium]
MKTDEIRSKTNHELGIELQKMKKELFDLRFKSATQSLPNGSRIRVLRRLIARTNTILNERALGVRGQEAR